jgi:hypothetical protein
MVNAVPTESRPNPKPSAFGFVYAVPYLILMFCRVSNFGAAQTTEVAADDGAQKMLLEAFAYGLAGLLIGFKLVSLKSLLGRLLPFYLYAMYAALTMVWSDHPESVEYRVGHMVGLLLVAVCISIWAQERRGRLFFLTAGFMLFALAASVALVFVLPSRGLSHPEWGSVGGSRWVGITGHPNLLGAAAFVGIWTALAVITMTKNMQLRLLAVFLIIFAIAALRGSDSRSSEISAAFCVVVFLLLRGGTPETFIGNFARRALVLAGFGGVVIAFGLLVAPEFVMQHLAPTARAGAGDVLSDRPLIWAMGADAIRDNPMGWTFDLLESYWDVHGRAVLFPHFHNGFLDVAVKGGPIAEVLLVAILVRMAWGIKALMRVDYGLFALYAAFFASNLLYNVIDTGFDREAILWPMMMVAWAVVEATLVAKARAAEAPAPAARNFVARVRPPPSAIGFE